MTLVTAGVLYLALGFLLWVHAWAEGATTHTLCGCGDPALFLWFFQWPATALAHGQNPFFSSALFHPTGINLLAQTSVTGLSLPLVPVTWIWGPVASLNVASTITPALTAFTAFVVIRRWVPWTPAAFVGGLLYGFSPFVLSSLEFAHLMTAALMLLPLILAVLDEILVRQRHGALGGRHPARRCCCSRSSSSPPSSWPSSPSSPWSASSRWWPPPWSRTRAACGRGSPMPPRDWPSGSAWAWCSWPGRSGSRSKGPASLSGLVWPNVGVIGGFIPSSFVTTGYPPAIQRLPAARRLRGRPARLRRLSGVELPRRHGGGPRRPSGATAGCGSSASPWSCVRPARWASGTGSGSRPGSSRGSRWSRTSLSNASWRSASWPPR